MKNKAIQLIVTLAVFTLPAAAGVVQILGSDFETGLTTNVSYTLRTTGNSSINGGQSGFTPSSGQSNLATANGVDYVNYLSSLPGGSTLSGATLDLSGLFSGLTYGSTRKEGTLFYQPVFSSTLSAYTVTITSTLANVSLSGQSATGYNLWPIFMNDILAGNSIDIEWSTVDTFAANTSTYGDNCKNCTEQLQVTNTANFTASNTANALHLTYSDSRVTSTPEPASLGLAGVALIGLGVVRRKKRA